MTYPLGEISMSHCLSRPRVLLIALAALAPPAARAQAVLGIGEDATAPPRGVVRTEISNTWTRFDDRRAGAGGTEVTLPARVRPTSLITEVGLLNGISLGVAVPYVSTRVDATFSSPKADGLLHADSLVTYDHGGLGDVELFSKFIWLQALPERERYAPPAGIHLRSALTGLVRFNTGDHDDPGNFFDIGLGGGQTDLEARSQSDVIFGRHFWTSVVGRYGYQLSSRRLVRVTPPGDPFSTAYPPFTATVRPGGYFEVEATPRLVLGRYFSVGVQYLYRRKAEDSYAGTTQAVDANGNAITLDASVLNAGTEQREQRITFGFVYSSVAPYAARKARFPFEVSYQHANSVSASGLRKISQDAVRVRVYVRLWGAR